MSGYEWHIPHIAFFALIQGRPKSAWSMLSWFISSYPTNYPMIYRIFIMLRGFFRSIIGLKENTKFFGNTPKSYAVIRYQEMFIPIIINFSREIIN